MRAVWAYTAENRFGQQCGQAANYQDPYAGASSCAVPSSGFGFTGRGPGCCITTGAAPTATQPAWRAPPPGDET